MDRPSFVEVALRSDSIYAVGSRYLAQPRRPRRRAEINARWIVLGVLGLYVLARVFA